jgi:MFS transporter, SET family, sugar efflux transporter
MNLAIWKRLIRAEYGLPLGLCILLQGLLIAVASPLLPILISDKIGLDKAGVTVFFLINTLVGIVVALGTGYVSDGAVARHKLVLVGGVVASLGYFGLAIATQPVHAFMAGAIVAGFAVLFPQLFAVAKGSVVADWKREDQVVGITALRTLFSFGFILGTTLASGLARVMDMKVIFFLVATAIFALTVYAARVLYRIEGHMVRQASRSAETNSNPAIESRKVVLPFYALIAPLIALTILRGADSTRMVYLPLVLFDLFGDASIAPLMFGITAVAELITIGLVGYLSSKIGEKTTIAISALSGGLCFLLLVFTQSLALLYVIQVLYAVFVAAMVGVAMAYIQGMFPDRVGMGGSVYMALFNVGSLIGILSPLLVTGYDQTVFVIPAILCVVGAVLLMVGDRTAQIEKRLREAPIYPAVVQNLARPTAAVDGEV